MEEIRLNEPLRLMLLELAAAAQGAEAAARAALEEVARARRRYLDALEAALRAQGLEGPAEAWQVDLVKGVIRKEAGNGHPSAS